MRIVLRVHQYVREETNQVRKDEISNCFTYICFQQDVDCLPGKEGHIPMFGLKPTVCLNLVVKQ